MSQPDVSQTRVAVVTDSTAGLSAAEVEKFGLREVDLDVIVDGHAVRESQLRTAEVAEAMRRRLRVRTSSPSPARFDACYQEAIASGATAVVSVHLSARGSGTCNVARIAGEQAGVPVRVVDTGQLGRATGVAALAGARAAAGGADLDAVAAAVAEAASAARTIFCVDDLEHLRRGGRLSATQTLLGSALSVKPILGIDDGLVVVLEKVRTAARARNRLKALVAEMVSGLGGPAQVSVYHVDAEPGARELLTALRTELAGRPAVVDLIEASPVIAAHVGPGALGFVVSPAPR